MHEGKKILQALTSNGYSVQDLADACGVKWTAAKKYIMAETLGAKAWQTCSTGLLKLGIDPLEIRLTTNSGTPARQVADKQFVVNADYYISLLGLFTHEQLPGLVELLEANEGHRHFLIATISGIIGYLKLGDQSANPSRVIKKVEDEDPPF